MTARMLTRAALPLLLGAGLFGCSNLVDPSTGQPQGQKTPPPAAEEPAPPPETAAAATAQAAQSATTPAAPHSTADLDRLKRESQTLKVQQAEAQARLDTLTKQMAQEREEQRRFREMMATNFDLLEQSVSKSLADNMDRNARKPAGDAKSENKQPVPGPAMVPPPAESESRPKAAPAQGEAQGPSALQPLPYWDDARAGHEPGASSAAKFDPRRPKPPRTAAATKAPPAKAAPPATAAMSAPPAQNGGHSAAQPPLPGMSGANAAKAQPSAQATSQTAAVTVPVAITAPGAPAAKPADFHDPDLEPPADPRALKAHPEAKPVYEKGFVYFAKGDHAESIRVYEDFLARFPDDNHSDNAQFWIGEAHLQLKQTDQADAAYRAVLRNYAHKSTLEGYKTPDAIYKLGRIALTRNDPARAEYYFRNVSERFPESTAGQKAQRELETIRVNTAAGEGEGIRPDS